MQSEKKSGDNLSSTQWHFSLFADPTKMNTTNKQIAIHSGESETDSPKNNITSTINDTNVSFKKKRDKSPKSSSSSSKSSSSSSRSSSSSSSKKSKSNTASYSGKTENIEKSAKPVYDAHKSEKINGTSYMHQNDDYDDLDDNKKLWKRMEVFAQLEHFKIEKKVKLMQSYDINSDYWQMKAELKYITDRKNTNDAVDLGMKGLELFAQGAEFLNRRYDPIGVDLNGWGDHMSLTKDNYKEVFAKLYEKHKDKGTKVEPEVQLVGMIFLSALMFHLSKSAVNTPGIGDMIKNNPALVASAESMLSKKVFPTEKTPEQIKKEQEAEMHKRYMEHKQALEKEKLQQQQMQQQTNIQNNPNFIGTNQTSLGTAPFSAGVNVMKRPNIANIINRAKNDVNTKTSDKININIDTDDMHISSVKPGRIEVTETSMRKSPDSINSSEIRIKTSRKSNRSLTI